MHRGNCQSVQLRIQYRGPLTLEVQPLCHEWTLTHARLLNTCEEIGKCRYWEHMSIAAEKLAEVLAWPEQDRAFLARQLIASLDETVESDAETQWNEVIDRRSREMAQCQVDTRSEEEMIRDIRTKLHARRPAS